MSPPFSYVTPVLDPAPVPCPECGGSGVVPILLAPAQVVTHEMALDAGEPTWEGSLLTAEVWDYAPCETCGPAQDEAALEQSPTTLVMANGSSITTVGGPSDAVRGFGVSPCCP